MEILQKMQALDFYDHCIILLHTTFLCCSSYEAHIVETLLDCGDDLRDADRRTERPRVPNPNQVELAQQLNANEYCK